MFGEFVCPISFLVSLIVNDFKFPNYKGMSSNTMSPRVKVIHLVYDRG